MNAWVNTSLELRGKLDGVSFEHNTKPGEPFFEKGDVKVLTYSLLLTKKDGSGGRKANFIVAIPHGHGVGLCELLKIRLVNLS